MKVNVIPVGVLSTNCYILQSSNNYGVIIDPGSSAQSIIDLCNKLNVKIEAIILTHGHFDHIGAVDTIAKKYNCKVYIHTNDNELLNDPQKSQSKFFTDFSEYTPIDADVLINDGDKITVDDITLTVMHTKGHTKGSVILIGDDVIFSGDTLFAQSIGRTDLYGGSMDEMRCSLEKIKQIQGEYTIYPGHGDKTNLSLEKRINPYLGTDYDDIF